MCVLHIHTCCDYCNTAATAAAAAAVAAAYDDDVDDDDDADKHKFCVIIGVGVNKFRTDVTEDLFDNPVFNTECDMSVHHLLLLSLALPLLLSLPLSLS